jgi:predicted  nucleic acid-binding Zn-ribbon protein
MKEKDVEIKKLKGEKRGLEEELENTVDQLEEAREGLERAYFESAVDVNRIVILRREIAEFERNEGDGGATVPQ